jgi:hypothetical protein
VQSRATILSDLAREMARQKAGLPLAGRLCAAAESILGVDGVAVTLAYTSDERVTLCCTDDVATRVEDLQDVLGQGPGRDAFTTGAQQFVDVGPSEDRRWPQFSSTVHDTLGPLRICAIPIRPHHDVLGVLTCHLEYQQTLALEAEPTQFLADAIGVALLRDPHATDTDLSGPWAQRAEVHQATGMVVAQLHISAEDALALLRAHAFAAGTLLGSIAKDVTSRRLDFRHHETTDGTHDDA